MLKRAVLLLFLSAVLFGCLPKRQVIDENLFHSPMPSIKIRIDQQLPYLGKTASSSFSFGVDDGRDDLAPERHETYYFVATDQGHQIERFTVIMISNLVEGGWFYVDDFEKWWQEPLRLGHVDLGDHTYKTADLLLTIEDSDFAKYFNLKSHTIVDCYAVKVLHRLPREDHQVTIWYGENCQRFGKQFNNTVSEKQKHDAIVQLLTERFEQAVTSEK